MKIKSFVIKALLFTSVICLFCAIWCFNPNILKASTVYAAEGTSESSTIASGSCGTGLTWQLTDDGILQIEGEGAMSTYSTVTAPWYNYRSGIVSVEVGSGVTSISSGAFA